jgi:hypothetical protein
MTLMAYEGSTTPSQPVIRIQTTEASPAEIISSTKTPLSQNPSATRSFTVRPTLASTTVQTAVTQTIDPASSLTLQAVSARSTQIAGFSPTCNGYSLHDASFSPNESWMAIRCDDEENRSLEVINQMGQRWVLQFKEYLSDDYGNGDSLPLGGLIPANWVNEEFLYFTSYIAFDGGGTCFFGFGYHGLFRLDLNTGYVSTILPIRSTLTGYQIEFSSNGRYLAYNVYNTPTIFDLRTGETFTIEVNENFAGNLTWSPDSTELAYATCQTTQDYYSVQESSIKIYSLDDHISRTIYHTENDIDLHIALFEKSTLQISEYNYQTNQSSLLIFDWSSGELKTPTPTLTP